MVGRRTIRFAAVGGALNRTAAKLPSVNRSSNHVSGVRPSRRNATGETTVFQLKFLVAFGMGAAVGVALFVGLAGKGSTPSPALGEIPTEREGLLVLKWVLENHKDARDLRFAKWFPPTTVPDNPITHEPSVLVRAFLENPKEPGSFEDYYFYVKDEQVLGGVSPHLLEPGRPVALARRLPRPPSDAAGFAPDVAAGFPTAPVHAPKVAIE
jgi:hypothetical protein